MIHGGRFANVDDTLALRKWSINETSEVKPVMHAGLNGGTVRSKGFTDWNGSWEEWGGEPVVTPGQAFDFGGFMGFGDDDDTEPLPANGYGVSGPARVNQIEITLNATSGSDPIAHKIDFAANGPLVKGVFAPAGPPGSVVVPQGPCNLKIAKKTTGSDVIWTAWTQAVLTFSRPSTEYSNASSGCQVQRRAGASLDLTVKLTDQEMVSQASIGDMLELKFYVDDTRFWLIKWLEVIGDGGIEADRETGAIISQTFDMGWSAYSKAGVPGYIVAPDGTALWGTAP